MNPWDEWAETLEGARHAVHDLADWDNETARHVKLIAEHVGEADGLLLDVGCGIGRLAIPVALATHLPVLGYDTSEKMLEHARAEAHQAALARGKDQMDPPVGFTSSFPFGPRSFAGAYSMLVFQHLPDEKVRWLLTQVRRVLRPGAPMLVQFAVGLTQADLTYERHPDDVSTLIRKAGLVEVDRWPDPVIPTWGWWKVVAR